MLERSAPRILSGSVQPIPERLGRRKRGSAGCRDLNDFSGCGIAPLTRGPLRSLKLPEPWNRNLVAIRDGLGQGGECGLENLLRFRLREAMLGSNLIGEIRDVHILLRRIRNGSATRVASSRAKAGSLPP